MTIQCVAAVTSELYRLAHLKPAEDPVFGRSVEHPALRPSDWPENTPEKKHIANANRIAFEVPLRCGHLPQRSTPPVLSRKHRTINVRIDVTVSIATDAPLGQVLDQIPVRTAEISERGRARHGSRDGQRYAFAVENGTGATASAAVKALSTENDPHLKPSNSSAKCTNTGASRCLFVTQCVHDRVRNS